jgi:hypothetical protein
MFATEKSEEKQNNIRASRQSYHLERKIINQKEVAANVILSSLFALFACNNFSAESLFSLIDNLINQQEAR